MRRVNRRTFLKLAGSGSAAVAAASVPVAGALLFQGHAGKTLAFRAEAGLPQRPLPSMVTEVIEGQLNLAGRTGVVTSTVFAGHPGSISSIAMPGMTRVIRVLDVRESLTDVSITGVVADRSQLRPGESSQVELRISRLDNSVTRRLRGHTLTMPLAI